MYILSIDAGTSSVRALIVDRKGKIVKISQKEFGQIYPKGGWCEHDPMEIFNSVLHTIDKVLTEAGVKPHEIASIGITNQRETTVAWDASTGQPLHNAIVWLDTRTSDICERYHDKDMFRHVTGLPISTYFSAFKIIWLKENVAAVKEAKERGTLKFGTVESWLVFKLSGHKVHVTDCTNASRYNLMNIHSLNWDPKICQYLNIDLKTLPFIVSNSEFVCDCEIGPLKGVKVTALIGDQHSALLGQGCLNNMDMKSTFGTGVFVLINTTNEIVTSKKGLLTTLSFKLGPNSPPSYALEGSISIGGRVINWLKDQMGVVSCYDDFFALANKTKNSSSVCVVPCFNGLFAPHWEPSARGVILGLSLGTDKSHICRSALESICLQSLDVIKIIEIESLNKLHSIKVDGGLTRYPVFNSVLCKVLNLNVFSAAAQESTALGCAFAAGLAVGFWEHVQNDINAVIEANGGYVKISTDGNDLNERNRLIAKWNEGLKRCHNLAKFE